MALASMLLWALVAATPGWASLVSLDSATTSSTASPVPSSGQPGEIGSPLRVAQCRARCLQRFSGGPNKETVCMQGPDCFMCWENCELLQSNYPVWGAMCTQKGICFPGCQQACKFHRETASVKQQIEPVIHTRGEEVITVGKDEDGGNVIRWQKPPPPRTSSVVYVVMTKEEGSVTWRQVTQTVDLEARLNDISNSVGRLGDTGIRVLVVDPEGLVTIYSPVQNSLASPASPLSASGDSAPTSAPVDATKTPDASPSPSSGPAKENVPPAREGKWLREDVTSPLDDAQHAMLFPTASSGDASLQVSRTGPWVPREVSLIHQKVLVIAEVAWEARVPRGVYLVTWEIDGGGLQGNLFTDTTCVTLSLWPNTIYHVQVELVSRSAAMAGSPPDRSEPMILDTHKAQVVVDPRVKSSVATPGADLSGGSIRFPIHLEQTDDAEEEGEGEAEQRLGNGEATRRKRRRRREEQLEQMELMAGSGAALLLFIAVVAGLAWRCRSRRRLLSGADGSYGPGASAFLESGGMKKKMVDDPLTSGFLQPIMTLVTEAARGVGRVGGGANGVLSSGMDGGLMGVGDGEGRRQGGVAKEGVPAHPISASRLPTVSVRGLGDQLQHPDSYAAFLRQAERCARNEVQV